MAQLHKTFKCLTHTHHLCQHNIERKNERKEKKNISGLLEIKVESSRGRSKK